MNKSYLIRIILIAAMLINSLGLLAQNPNKAYNASKHVHIVFFKFKAGTSQDQINNLKRGIEVLDKSIPGILEVSFGLNFSERSKGYSHAVIIDFVDRSSLLVFMDMPNTWL